MPLLAPGFPPGPLDVEVPLLETVADHVLHADPDCREILSWALGNREFVERVTNLGVLFSGPSERFCGCTMTVLDESQADHLEIAATFEMLCEEAEGFSPTAHAPWVGLLRLRAHVEYFTARLVAADGHREVLEVLEDRFAALSAKLDALHVEALAAHPWEATVREWMQAAVPSEVSGSLAAGTSHGLRNGVNVLERLLRPYGDRSQSRLPLEVWTRSDARAAEGAAVEVLVGKQERAPHFSEFALARLTSELVGSAVSRATRAALRLPEYVIVVHDWRRAVLESTPLTRVLAEAICRSETVVLPDGALGLRVPGLLGHELWDANRRQGGFSFGHVFGALTFFKGNGVHVDLSNWKPALEIALTLWLDAGGVVERPADRGYSDRKHRPGPDPSEFWPDALFLAQS